ncbi:MAG: hypothetical protein K0R08_1857 [Solimicrobium sp.]|nr:hypothetical protein [Solimicrobium sp.]
MGLGYFKNRIKETRARATMVLRGARHPHVRMYIPLAAFRIVFLV